MFNGKYIWIILLLCFFVALPFYYFYPESKLPPGIKIDRILVIKSERKLFTYVNGKQIKTYSVSLGRHPKGAKEFKGDNKTPEGIHTINDKNPNSICHKNLGISYPNKEDSQHARRNGKVAGGDIKIHGLPNGMGIIGKFHRWVDLTNGCIMVTDEEVDELYNAVIIGTQIEIKP